MIKVYGMPTCPNCQFVHHQIEGNPDFEFIDIGSDIRKLKEFILLRDSDYHFEAAKANGLVGIPCFVLEDGSVELDPGKVGLKRQGGVSCKDGKNC